MVGRFGAKRVWVASLVLFTGGSVLCGAAWSVPALIVFRVVQGLGGGLILPVGQVMLARAAGPQRMGRIMAVIAVPAMLAPVLGPTIGGLIVNTVSWRWMFYVNVPFCVLAVVLAITMLPNEPRGHSTRLDVAGLVLLSPGLAAMVYGLSEAGRDNGKLAEGAALGGLLILAFLIHSIRKARPLLDISLFRRRSFGASTAALFVYAGAASGLTMALPLYYQVIRGFSPLAAGMLVAPLGLGAMVSMPIAGRLTDRRDARGVAITGLVTMLAGTSVYTQLEPGTSLVVLTTALFVVGLGHGAIFPSLQSAAYSRLDHGEVPAGTTMTNIVMRLGMSFGTAALAVILQLYLIAGFPGSTGNLAELAGLTDRRELLSQAFGHSLWWAFGLASAALLPMLLVPQRKVQPNRPEM